MVVRSTVTTTFQSENWKFCVANECLSLTRLVKSAAHSKSFGDRYVPDESHKMCHRCREPEANTCQNMFFDQKSTIFSNFYDGSSPPLSCICYFVLVEMEHERVSEKGRTTTEQLGWKIVKRHTHKCQIWCKSQNRQLHERCCSMRHTVSTLCQYCKIIQACKRTLCSSCGQFQLNFCSRNKTKPHYEPEQMKSRAIAQFTFVSCSAP